MNVKIKLRFLILAAAALTLGFAFQNCGEVKIDPRTETSLANTSLDGEFCSLAALSEDTFVNLIFVVDMSGSNVRKISGGNYTATGATDPTGIRFQMIRNFINSSCITDKSKARFSVFGFSGTTMPANGCDVSRLVNGTDANAQIMELETIQSNEPLNPPTNMRSTVYDAALNCAGNLVQSHIASLSAEAKKNNIYHVMFLSDGGPTDSGGTAITGYSGIYTAIDSIKTFGKTAAGAIVQPILYGANLLSQSELTAAQTVMTEMAKRGDSIDSAVSDPNQINFCDLFRTGRRTPYVVSSFGVINLTAVMKNGKFKADSDMDGIPDDEEKARGFDPSLSRSFVGGNQLLDGVCRFNADQCAPHTCGLPNAFGLTDCETLELTLGDGIDTDSDDMPDLVEIMKGSLASQADANSDTDGDGTNNGKEMLVGRDPNFADASVDSQYLIDVTRYRSDVATSACPSNQERWMFSAQNIPLAPTLATSFVLGDSITAKTPWRVHAQDENVLLVYYTVKQANAMNDVPAVMYGHFFKIKQGQAVKLDKFEKLGVVDGVFKALP